jgi:hypothetical protein
MRTHFAPGVTTSEGAAVSATFTFVAGAKDAIVVVVAFAFEAFGVLVLRGCEVVVAAGRTAFVGLSLLHAPASAIASASAPTTAPEFNLRTVDSLTVVASAVN